MMCCCFLRPMRKHLTSISYITRNLVVRAFLVILKSRVRLGTEFCRIALWYLSDTIALFIGYYEVAQGAESKFAPKTVSLFEFDGKLL